MNPRERFLAVMNFETIDKIPFEPGGPRESTLARWRRDGMPEEGNWYGHLVEALGLELEQPRRPVEGLDVDTVLLPQFEEKVLEHRDGHYVVQDWKGNICEIADTFDVSYLRAAKDFVTRRWIKCPVETRDDWEAMKERYDVDDPGRFPEDFAERCVRLRERDFLLSLTLSGPFWQLREWCGFEGLCMLMLDDPDFVDEMADFWKTFVSGLLDRILDHVVLDRLYINEDMAYKAKAMISPDMARRFCQPCWVDWTRQVKQRGVPLVELDSDGYIGELIPLWIESGIQACSPMEVAAHNDLNAFRAAFGRSMAYRGGVDKRCMAKGGTVIERELARLEPVVKDGGYIPGCDHAVPSDVSWPDFVRYAGLLAKMTGWL